MNARDLVRIVVPIAFVTLVANVGTAAATAAAPALHHGGTIVHVGANKSNNWSGYNQGALEQGGKTFSSISGSWTVPTATARNANEAEYSASWIGIGGGCIDAGCMTTDGTLIQDGTSQDIDSTGRAHYYAWWELIPAPSVNLTGCSTDANCTVAAGDRMTSTISTPANGLWTFSMADTTRGWTWTMTAPYSSTQGSAEWIEETPVVIDNSGKVTIGPMPNLSATNFDVALTNGVNAGLKASEEIQLVDANNNAIATPSSPDPDADGFNVCTYAASCGSPAGS